jgi:hypothetical protein
VWRGKQHVCSPLPHGITPCMHARTHLQSIAARFDAPAKVSLLSVTTTTPAAPGQVSELVMHGLGVEMCMLAANTPPHGINLYSHDLVHLRISATKFRCPS